MGVESDEVLGVAVAKGSKAVESVAAFPFGSAGQLARAVRTGQVSAVELLRAYLERVDRLNPAINAIVVDDRERALKDARAADRARAKGAKVGPLHGVPMTVKESFNIPGQPTTFGFPAFAGNVATTDAVAVARLRAAGAVIFGKTNVPMSLADFQSYNDVYGTTNNPWDLTRGAGGSSGGAAAALAAGLTGLEFGSDIGGSIRNPAAYNGVYGHKPTYGIVPKRGHTLSELLVGEGPISVVGPLARSAEDLALALKVTAGPDLEDGYRLRLPAPPKSLAGLRVAVWLDQPDLAPVDDRVTGPIEDAARALERAGAKLDFDARPAFDVGEANDTYLQLLLATMSARNPQFDTLVAQADALADDDRSEGAKNLRLSTARHRDVLVAAEARDRAPLGVAGVLPGPRRAAGADHRHPAVPPRPLRAAVGADDGRQRHGRPVLRPAVLGRPGHQHVPPGHRGARRTDERRAPGGDADHRRRVPRPDDDLGGRPARRTDRRLLPAARLLSGEECPRLLGAPLTSVGRVS